MLNVPAYNHVEGERIFYRDGMFMIYGEDGQLWYRVVADNPTSDDFAAMEANRPMFPNKVINNENIAEWRKSVGIVDNSDGSK